MNWFQFRKKLLPLKAADTTTEICLLIKVLLIYSFILCRIRRSQWPRCVVDIGTSKSGIVVWNPTSDMYESLPFSTSCLCVLVPALLLPNPDTRRPNQRKTTFNTLSENSPGRTAVIVGYTLRLCWRSAICYLKMCGSTLKFMQSKCRMGFPWAVQVLHCEFRLTSDAQCLKKRNFCPQTNEILTLTHFSVGLHTTSLCDKASHNISSH